MPYQPCLYQADFEYYVLLVAYVEFEVYDGCGQISYFTYKHCCCGLKLERQNFKREG